MQADLRKNNRIQTEMKLRSVSLPRYAAKVVDISEGGARIELEGKIPSSLVEERIRFGLSLNTQMSPQFEGFARIAWIKETERGVEAGLQWEKMSAADWERARALAAVA